MMNAPPDSLEGGRRKNLVDPAELHVRCAEHRHVPELVQLEESAWPHPLRGLAASDIAQRISRYPSGQLILVDSAGKVMGSLYTQRINSLDALQGRSFNEAIELHADGGPIWQLVSIQVQSSQAARGLGEQMIQHALMLAKMEGSGRAVAVTRCRSWVATRERYPSRSMLEHAREGSDPGICFHTARGATVIGLVPGWRADDADNGGTGILVCYDVRAFQLTRSAPARSMENEQHALRLAANQRSAELTALVTKLEQGVRRVVGVETMIGFDAPLMEAGVDSYLLPSLARDLAALTGSALLPTVVLECGTLRGLASHVLCQQQGPKPPPAPPQEMWGQSGTAATLMSVAGRWPASCSLPHISVASGDAISQVPLERWAMANPSGGTEEEALRHGGFLRGCERFDSGMFGISAAEAGAMDPQQRLLLEEGYVALSAAGRRRADLVGLAAGVFVGIMNTDYASFVARGKDDVYSATGGTLSVAAGRLSFVLGLQGPCIGVDTACSAALAALHTANRELQAGDCEIALAAGVNILLSPLPSVRYNAAGMLASDGRCKTWDARANGYVRAEGVGCCAMVRQAMGSISLASSAIQQDGRSASLTAPNGSAQAHLLAHATAKSGLGEGQVRMVEAHGTGTRLGDPTEVGALVQSLPGATLGSIKASVGHAEPAAGMAGLLRAVDILRRAISAGNAQLRTLNPLVRDRMHPRLMRLCLQAGFASAAIGVSSFGYSGTIAHAVLRRSAVASAVTFPLPPSPAALQLRRRLFLWQEPIHPLLQLRLTEPCDDNLASFRSPISGALRLMISDHVLQGRVVFPGSAYLETARAACKASAVTGSGTDASLGGVFFLTPLSLGKGAADLLDGVRFAEGQHF